MTSEELREKFLSFFEKKGHKRIPSASLIPDNDPTVLFTTAGMHPLVPYFTGQPHAEGKRLVNFQKCIRTVDIDEVGDPYHHTFFEMMGFWSLGDYFKKEAIEMTFEFHTKVLKIDPNKYAVSVFSGDENALRDDESANIWKGLGVPEERIVYLPKKENWWGPAGEMGPCGTNTEMFYWVGQDAAPKEFDTKNKNWVEIGNDVLLEYNKTSDGKYVTLSQKNVDFGGGFERTLAILNNFDDDYKTELFLPIINKIEEVSNKQYGLDKKTTRAMRIIADHLRCATFLLGDTNGIPPSNTDQGYVLRRLIRRAIRYGKQIGIQKLFTVNMAKVVIEKYENVYPELKKNKLFIESNLTEEELQFSKTLEKGLKQFEKISSENISAHDAFILFSTYGFPLEMTQEMAKSKGISVDSKGFEKEFNKHQNLSRTAAAGRFKGGLADASEATVKMHTATHLLLAALRKVLGDHVFQKGSNITSDRLRLDFSHPEKMTPDQKKEVENLVNEQIKKCLNVDRSVMTLDEAKKLNAMGVFENKYEENVSVYTVGDSSNPFSREICGGPHVKNTAIIGGIKIKKEESSSSGIRRIKAILV